MHVIGLGLPNDNKAYVHAGITTAVILWNTTDLGSPGRGRHRRRHCRGTLKPGDSVPVRRPPRPRQRVVERQRSMLGVPFVFDKSNIDGFDF